MKNLNYKILLAFLIMLGCLFSAGSRRAYAETLTSGDWEYSVDGGVATLITYLGTAEGEITIPATLDEYSVTQVGDYIFEDCTSVTEVVLPDSVISILEGAFLGCTSLANVTWSNNLQLIDVEAFSNTALTTLSNLPNTIEYIGFLAFANCASLTDVILPDSLITLEEQTFLNCTALTSVDIGTGVTSIGYFAFRNCNSLVELTIPGNVREFVSNSLGEINNLHKITFLTNDNNETLVIPARLLDCNFLLKYIKLPQDPVIISDYGFDGLSQLDTLIIPDKIISIGNLAFAECDALSTLIFPEGLETVGDRSFLRCDVLRYIVFPESLTQIGIGALNEDFALETVILKNANTNILMTGTDAANVTYVVKSHADSTAQLWVSATQTNLGADTAITFQIWDGKIENGNNPSDPELCNSVILVQTSVTIIDITVTPNITISIDPVTGVTVGGMTIVNNTKAPVHVNTTGIAVSPDSFFQPAEANKHGETWTSLNKAQSADIFFQLELTDNWKSKNTTTLTVTGVGGLDGTIAPKQTATISIGNVKHGRSFTETKTSTFEVSWIISLE